MTLLKFISCFAFGCFLNSCILSGIPSPFVASSYEPVVVKKKKEVQGSVGLRPFNYGYGDLTYAIGNSLAIRLSGGGFIGLGNLSGSFLYYKTLPKINYFAGAFYNFQSNQMQRSFGYNLGEEFMSYRYSCVYNSPGIVFGLTLKGEEKVSHHFIFKSQYNIVSSYNYSFENSDRYKYFKNEQLGYPLPDFLSFEPSYSSVIKSGNKNYFKIQAGFHFTQKTLRHHYVYDKNPQYGSAPVWSEATTLHPVSFPINISISYIFYSKKD